MWLHKGVNFRTTFTTKQHDLQASTTRKQRIGGEAI
jgi:hypothetical protein